MATVQFAVVDGERVDITAAERITETRCDGCGQFVPSHDVAQIGASFSRGGVQLPGLFLEGHLDHILEKAGRALEQAGRELGP